MDFGKTKFEHLDRWGQHCSCQNDLIGDDRLGETLVEAWSGLEDSTSSWGIFSPPYETAATSSLLFLISLEDPSDADTRAIFPDFRPSSIVSQTLTISANLALINKIILSYYSASCTSTNTSTISFSVIGGLTLAASFLHLLANS